VNIAGPARVAIDGARVILKRREHMRALSKAALFRAHARQHRHRPILKIAAMSFQHEQQRQIATGASGSTSFESAGSRKVWSVRGATHLRPANAQGAAMPAT